MNWKILYKYVQGECTGKELKELGDWLQEGSANDDFFTSFIEDWEEKKEVRFHKDDQTAWRELKEKHIIPGTGQEIRPGISRSEERRVGRERRYRRIVSSCSKKRYQKSE